MTLDDYREEIAAIGHGKRLPDALYIYDPTSHHLPDRLRRIVQELRQRLELTEAFNVLKLVRLQG